MNLTPKTLSLLAVAASAAAGVATLVWLPVVVDQFTITGYRPDGYRWAPLPYIVLAILAIVFRRTCVGAAISLIGALVLGGLGVYAKLYVAPDAYTVLFLPYILLTGCGVVLFAQWVRWTVMQGTSAMKMDFKSILLKAFKSFIVGAGGCLGGGFVGLFLGVTCGGNNLLPFGIGYDLGGSLGAVIGGVFGGGIGAFMGRGLMSHTGNLLWSLCGAALGAVPVVAVWFLQGEMSLFAVITLISAGAVVGLEAGKRIRNRSRPRKK